MSGLWSFPNERVVRKVIDLGVDSGAPHPPKLQLWLGILGLTHKIEDFVNWCLRWAYAQHNARALVDMETRMAAVICEASGNMMSKPYYTKEAMLAQIGEHHSNLWRYGYNDGLEDAQTLLMGEFADPAVEHHVMAILEEAKSE